MKRGTISGKSLIISAWLMLLSFIAAGQMPQCDKVYLSLLNNLSIPDTLMMYDPALPVSATNPSINTIALPPLASGLAISPILGSSNPALTYYTTSGSTFWYYNPATSAWVNTGHTIGQSTNVNIAAGGGYIYTLRGFGNAPGVYRYDGTGNAVWIATALAPLPYDLVADCEGNFYIISSLGPAWSMTKYSSSGAVLQGYTVNNPNNYFLSGGLGIVGSTFYSDDANSKGIAIGNLTGTTLSFSSVTAPIPILQAGFRVNDMATCPRSLNSLGTVSISPGDTTVCPGSTITFNANGSGTNPQYQWLVDGVPVSGATGASFTYTPTGNSEVKVQMSQSGPCASVTVTSPASRIVVPDLDDVTITLPATGCVGDTLRISSGSTGNGTFNWGFGGGVVASGTGPGPYLVYWKNPGTYSVHIDAQFGLCKVSDTAEITIGSPPALSLTATVADLCIGDTVLVTATTDTGSTLDWPSGTDYKVVEVLLGKARIRPEGNSVISVKATSRNGCSTIATLPVSAHSCCHLTIPSAFTPNGDNVNDRFGPLKDRSARVLALMVYNRWGQMIYFNSGNPPYWDGSYKNRPLETGTYFYLIQYSCNGDHTVYQEKGDVTLIR